MQFNVKWPEIAGHADPRWCWGCLGVATIRDTVDGRCPHCGRDRSDPPGTGTVERLHDIIDSQEAVVREAVECLSDTRPYVSEWAAERLPQAEKSLAILRAAAMYLSAAVAP